MQSFEPNIGSSEHRALSDGNDHTPIKQTLGDTQVSL